MTDSEVIRLLTLLAQYTEEYGKDLDPDCTLRDVADDLAGTVSDSRLQREAEGLSDRIDNGLNQ